VYGLPQGGAISTQGAIAKHLILASPKPMILGTELMSDGRWVGHQYLTHEILAGIVFPRKQDISEIAVAVRTLVGRFLRCTSCRYSVIEIDLNSCHGSHLH